MKEALKQLKTNLQKARNGSYKALSGKIDQVIQSINRIK